MKIINRVSLRMRITLLTGVALVLCSAVLTITASFNARSQFQDLFVAEPIRGDGVITEVGEFSLTTAPVTYITKARENFDATNISIFLVVIVLGSGMVYFMAGKAMKPMNKLCETISSISENNLYQRIQMEDRNDEVGAIGRSFNVMLERLEKSFIRQKRFSANVAHELKTPLTTINAGIQVLNLDEEPSLTDYKNTIATTERNIHRLISIVEDLMRLCDERDDFEISQIEINPFFDSICTELKSFIEEKRIKVAVDNKVEIIYGNHDLLYRAFFNLIENAIKYNKVNGNILIETIVTYDGLKRITISDTGYGVPADELQQIFEPFYRADKSRSRKTGGAGLGLSIVKTILERHGWEISADSVVGQGSAFTITVKNE